MPECPRCHVSYFYGESHNCRGIGGSGRQRRRRGAAFHFVIACVVGGLLGAVIGMPVLYFVRSQAVFGFTMGLGMFITFMWLRMRRVD